MADITIRPARPGDAMRLGEIGIAAWRKGIAALVDPAGYLGGKTVSAYSVMRDEQPTP